MNFKKIICMAVVAAVLAVGGYQGRQAYVRHQKIEQERRYRESRLPAWHSMEQKVLREINGFRGVSGVIVKDLRTGLEFRHNPDKPFASASLAKLPIMAIYLVAADQGKVRLDQVLQLKSSDKLEGSGRIKHMPAGTPFTIWELLHAMIAESDNTATNMLTQFVGRERLDDSFKVLGLQRTTLSRRIADYQTRDRKGIENYTSAGDMAALLERMYRKKLRNAEVSDRGIQILRQTVTNDRIPRLLPKGVPVAHKTGLENGICHDAGIIFTPEMDMMVILLTQSRKDASSNPAKRFMGQVALHAYDYTRS